MQSNYSILFYIKKNEPKKSGLFSVMGRITINKKDSVFNTKVEVAGDDWNSIERGQNIRSAGAKVVKNYLDIIRTKAQEHYWMLYEQGQEPDADSIRNLLTGAKQAEETLLKLFDLHNEQMRVRVGVDLTKETHSRYVLIRERLAMYLKEKRHVEDISIRKVSLAFIQDFETYMRANFPVNTNMLYKYMLENTDKMTH